MLQEKKKIMPIIKRAVRGLFTATFFAGTFYTGIQIGKEIYQEATTENTVVDLDYGFASIVLQNKDTRTPQELFSDVEQAILKIDSLKKVFEERPLSLEEKKAIVEEIITVMSEEANIPTKCYITYDNPETDTVGFYISVAFPSLNITPKKIFIKEDQFESYLSIDLINITIHEMLHAIYYENILRNPSMEPIEKKLYFREQLINKFSDEEFYFSTMDETNVQLLTEKIKYSIFNIYNSVYIDKSYASIMDMVDEIIELSQEDNVQLERYTLEEIFLKGYTYKLDRAYINYSKVDLKQTEYYQTFAYAIPEELLTVRYIDFINHNYAQVFDNVEERMSEFEIMIQQFQDEDYSTICAEILKLEPNRPTFNLKLTSERIIAFQLSTFVNTLRYHSEEYSEEEQNLIQETIINHIGLIADEHLAKFAIDDIKTMVEENNAQTILEELIP